MANSHLTAPFAGTVVSVPVAAGDRVPVGAPLLILESMKMEHVVAAGHSGTVVRIGVAPGEAVAAHATLMEIEEGPVAGELQARVANTLDAGRPDVTARRHAAGRRTARENIEDLCDPGTFEEYGALASRRSGRAGSSTISSVARRLTV
jgi:pyruvate/2-oxoglutarate dehydrogenase complex dihydrolipoamide acyltransferase (E2) component